MKLLFLADSTRTHTIKYLQYFYEKGYEIELITPTPFQELDINVHLILNCQKSNGALKKYWYLKKAAEVKKIIQRIQPDLLHALFVTNFGFLGAYSQFHPLIVTAYGPDILITPPKNISFRFMTKYCLQHADLINSVAPPITDAILKMNINPKKIFTFKYFVDLDRFNFAVKHKAETSGRYTVLGIEHPDNNSNLKTLIKAIPIVLSYLKNVWFIFLCSRPTQAQLKNLASELKVAEHVAFPDVLSESKIFHYFQMADIYISIPEVDGMPQSLLEAMACGIFPIVSNIPAYQIFIKDGIDGFCVAPKQHKIIAQKIIEALENPDLRQEAAKSNLNKMQKLPSFEKNLELLEYEYMKLIKKTTV